MLKLDPPALDAVTSKSLAALQARVDAAGAFADQVALAAKSFSAQNKKRKPTFDAVKVALTKMCAGARRCNYCEDSCADEVEHLWPKNLFPGRVFVWANYCYACGGCNGPKNNKFALFKGSTPTPLAPKVKPFRGPPVLIDPREDDPIAYLVLDVLGTFAFAPDEGQTAKARARAQYTIDVLGLNRDPLPKARKNAYGGYVARLGYYCQLKAARAAKRQLELVRDDLCVTPHPTVWYEALRFRAALPPFDALLGQAPEALWWKVGGPS